MQRPNYNEKVILIVLGVVLTIFGVIFAVWMARRRSPSPRFICKRFAKKFRRNHNHHHKKGVGA